MTGMPLKLKSGTTIGPVALVCLLVAFLSFLAAVLLMIFYADEARVAYFVRPAVPALTVVGGYALLWLKQHTSTKLNTQQNAYIAGKADQAVATVDRRLNGELDGRIKDAVVAGVNQLRSELAGVSGPAPLTAASADQLVAAQAAHPAHAADPTPTPAPGNVVSLPQEIPHG